MSLELKISLIAHINQLEIPNSDKRLLFELISHLESEDLEQLHYAATTQPEIVNILCENIKKKIDLLLKNEIEPSEIDVVNEKLAVQFSSLQKKQI